MDFCRTRHLWLNRFHFLRRRLNWVVGEPARYVSVADTLFLVQFLMPRTKLTHDSVRAFQQTRVRHPGLLDSVRFVRQFVFHGFLFVN